MNAKTFSAALAAALIGALSAEPMIDFSTAEGPVKPVNAVLRDGGFKVRAIDAVHDFDETACPESVGKDTVLLFER